jgi:hypothetical protein
LGKKLNLLGYPGLYRGDSTLEHSLHTHHVM